MPPQGGLSNLPGPFHCQATSTLVHYIFQEALEFFKPIKVQDSLRGRLSKSRPPQFVSTQASCKNKIEGKQEFQSEAYNTF